MWLKNIGWGAEMIKKIIESSFRRTAAIFKEHEEMAVKNAEAHKRIENRIAEKRKFMSR